VIKDVLSYLYINAKVMAKEGKFISPTRWDDLWGCASPAEISSILEGTDYFPYLAEGATHEAKELERSILEEFAALAKEIADIMPKGAWPIREYLLRRWDVMNLRTIMRGIHGDLEKAEIMEALVEGGELDFSFLKNLIDAEGMDGFVAMLTKTPYNAIAEGLAGYQALHNLFFLEASLDKIFWGDLFTKVMQSKGLREFKDFIEVYVDTHNLKMIFRAKKEGLSLEDVGPFLIPSGALANKITAVFDEEEISGFISLLEDTDYIEPLLSAQAEYERTGSVFPFEIALNKFVEHKADDIRKKKPFGPGPLIGFIVSKEAEVKRLLAAVRSTEVGLDRETIREMVTG
jgi:V/A-type H+/Na+-transporting ATPase subunit C